MKRYQLIHFGIGNVGKTFIKQLFANRERIKQDFAVELVYCGMFGSKGGFFRHSGFSEQEVICNFDQLLTPKIANPFTMLQQMTEESLENTIIIDTTTSSQMFSLLAFALKNHSYAVLSNKRPLAESFNEFKKLQKLGGKRFAYETTVGAGLPVIKILKELLATGDDIIEMSGCFSGTLGFICSALEKGMPFSQSVTLAKERGFTEFDPREDLSGMDVARKAIILARMIGREIEIEDLAVVPLFPDKYRSYSVATFMEKVHALDNKYKNRFEEALKRGMTLRYIATISQKKCAVRLAEVSQNSPLGNLKGPDNMIVFKTKRYFENPLVIQGPGAGLEVTAAGVFGDILSRVAL